MLESLVLLRRTFCWDMDDIVHIALKAQLGGEADQSGTRLSNDTQLAANEHLWVDTLLFDVFNATLWDAIAQEEGFDEEVTALRSQLRVRCASVCPKNHSELITCRFVDSSSVVR